MLIPLLLLSLAIFVVVVTRTLLRPAREIESLLRRCQELTERHEEQAIRRGPAEIPEGSVFYDAAGNFRVTDITILRAMAQLDQVEARDASTAEHEE
jgi:hypothetical protein